MTDDSFMESVAWRFMQWFYGQLDTVFVNSEEYRRSWITRGFAPEKLKISTDENFAQIQPFIGTTIKPVAFEAIRHFTDQFYTRNAQLFHERIAQHRILDCHGDLRLDHIHLTPKTTTIFDCIEFNEEFRYCDAASEIAFLSMDLDFLAVPMLSDHFVTSFQNLTKDADLLRLLPLYKTYRACVRGKVETLPDRSSR